MVFGFKFILNWDNLRSMTEIDVLNHRMTEIGVFYPMDLKFLT